jgi:hypothetical protein
MFKLLAVALLVIAALDQPHKSARERFIEIEGRAVAAAKAGDHGARVAADKELLHLLNGSPEVLEALARAYAASGDAQQALASLNQFADLGLADEGLLNGKDRRLAAIEKLPEFHDVLARFTVNRSSVSLGMPAITLGEAGLLAEDIDYDPQSQSFLVTSVLEKKIVRVRLDGLTKDLASSPDHWPMAAVKIDAVRRRVWATEVAFDGFRNVPQAAWGRAAVLCFDLESGKLLTRIEAPSHTSLGDMVLDRLGNPIVSDGKSGGIYLVSKGQIVAMDRTNFISPQTPALLPSGDSVLVPDYVRGIARFDLGTRQVFWLNQDGVDKVALNGVDGIYFYRHSLILTQNGTSPQRVIQVQLDPSFAYIVSSRIIEQSTIGLDDPTHGVMIGDSFYYIVNSGWAELDEHGAVKPGLKMTPARIMKYQLN